MSNLIISDHLINFHGIDPAIGLGMMSQPPAVLHDEQHLTCCRHCSAPTTVPSSDFGLLLFQQSHYCAFKNFLLNYESTVWAGPAEKKRTSLSFADADFWGLLMKSTWLHKRWQPAGKIQKSQPQQTDRQLPVLPARSRWPCQGKPAHILWLAMDHTAAPRLYRWV